MATSIDADFPSEQRQDLSDSTGQLSPESVIRHEVTSTASSADFSAVIAPDTEIPLQTIVKHTETPSPRSAPLIPNDSVSSTYPPRAPSSSDVVTAEPVSEGEDTNDRAPVSLPLIDEGRRAWTFVFCSFVLENLIWGFPFSFGVFQEYYLHTPPFNKSSEGTINMIGNIAVGLQYIEVPFMIAIGNRYPHWINTMSWCALAACSSALLLSSFANATWQLIVLQGVVVGISGGVIYAPIVIWLGEWFVKRRALAGSVIFGGSGVGGALFPLLINYLLTHTGGFRWTLRIMAILIAVCGGIAFLGVRPRVPIAPVSRVRGSRRAQAGGIALDLSFFKSPLFILVSLATLTQSMAYFPVSLYIPSYSAAIGLSTLDGTIALAVFNLARVVGQVIFGHICDKTAYTYVIIFSATTSALSAFLMWGFAHNLAVVFAFVITFGAIGGGYSSVSPSASSDIVGTGAQQSGLVYGCLGMFKGAAVIIGPAISAALHQRGKANPARYGGYGFTLVELFVGSMMVATTLWGFAIVFLRRKRTSVTA